MQRMFSLGLLMLVGLVGCTTSAPSGVHPVQDFEVDKYLGTWYEVARLDHSFERGLSNVTAQYSWNDDGTIAVLNRGYNEAKQKWEQAEGKAKFQGKESIGSLKVSFFGPFYGGYHIVELDEDYQHVLIVGPTKQYLWVLAREPVLDESIYSSLVEHAKELGFPTKKLIRVEHNKTESSEP